MEKTWRCTVCGYLHKGDQPPETCPLCHADASKFELVSDPKVDVAEPTRKIDKLKAGGLALIEEMKAAFVPHAISAHFPTALLPTSFLFLLIYFVSSKTSFETALFYLLLVAVLSVPPTFATGFLDWKKNYAGELSPIFRKKITLGLLLFVLGFVVIVWRWLNPEVLTSGGFSACAFSILLLIMLVCVTLLGHYGGMLVFAKQGK